MNIKITILFFFFFSHGIIIQAEESAQQFEGFNLSGYGEGNKKTWDIKGQRADILGDNIKVTDIIANAYGEEQTILTAKYGTLDKVTGKIHLEKDVVITTDSGVKMTTDALDWDRNNDLVKTDSQVVLNREGMTAIGTGATGHPNLKIAQLNEDVTVKIDTKKPEDPEGSTVTITCDGPVEVEYDKQRAVFNNNVVAIEGDRKLIADKMELFFDTVSKQIKEMICTGHVSITQGGNTTYSDKATYNAVEKKVTLSGSPKLILYTQEKSDTLPFGEDSSK